MQKVYEYDVTDGPTARKILNLPPELVQAIEDYRYENRVPSWTEAARQLLRAGLKARGHRPHGERDVRKGRKVAGQG